MGVRTGWAPMHSLRGEPAVPAHLVATKLNSQEGSSAGPQARYSL